MLFLCLIEIIAIAHLRRVTLVRHTEEDRLRCGVSLTASVLLLDSVDIL